MQRATHTHIITTDTLKKKKKRVYTSLNMARVPCKHLLLLAFLLLCFFISLSHGARSLGVTSVGSDDQKMKGQDVQHHHDDQKMKGQDVQHHLDDHQVAVKPTDQENGGVPENDEELVSVDYTPARRKPPIHN